ncbi:sodium-dependent transporter [Kordiimonas aquimaris]|uniref:sodium-dependent transporter n=1 Tax=Kordiimonas aquimaris TaxID=707591 RepID=UPI0021D072FC|nr:sodium-dependent transporter [Kordiimonas aquimaris]
MAISTSGGGQENWSSRAAFIFAAVGSAVGLGNIWRFPYIAGENGGGAFVLIYIFFVFLIGWPVLVSELAIGRYAGKSPIGSVEKIAVDSGKSANWKWLGFLGTFAGGLALLSYYSVIAGWVMAYVIKALTGTFVGITAPEAQAELANHYANGPMMAFWHLAFICLTIFIVGKGIKGGLEKAVLYLMPMLFVILLVLVGYSMAVGNFQQGLAYLFAPDFSKITAGVVIAALGQALFSLSVAVGTMFAYGAYLSKDISITKSAGIIAAADTGVALLAGLAIFPLVFAFGLQPNSGPGLLFETLPVAFAQMPGGILFGTLFFVLLGVAAITSSISLLEPAVSYFGEKLGMGRWVAAIIAGGIAFTIGLLSVFSFNDWAEFYPLAFLGLSELAGSPATFYQINDFFVSNIVLPIGGLFVALFAGWAVSSETIRKELDLPEGGLFAFWRVLIRFICPAALVVILVSGLS